MSDVAALKERVAKACRIAGKLNLTKAATGHISARLGTGGNFLIRARGPDELGVRYTTAEQVITMNADGKKIEGPDGLTAPQEVFIHSSIYKRRPEVMSVVHIHPATVVLFTACQKPIKPIFGAYDPSGLRLIVSGLSHYPRSILIKNDALGEDLADAMGPARACLMRGHGITTVGASVEDATLTAIKLNEAAEMNYQAVLLGDPQPISDEDIKSFVPEYGTDRLHEVAAIAPLKGNSFSAWRYYADFVGEGD